MKFFFLILLIIIYLIYSNRNKHTYFTNTDNYYEFKNNTNHDSFNDEDMGKYRNNNLIEIKKPEINTNTNPTLTFTNFTQIIYENETYHLLGKAINTYYNINYLIYESNIKFGTVYNYLLVSIIDNKQIIKHIINLRDKININDTIYLSENTFQLGPLLITPY